jgi:hypothetical protein
MSLATSSPGNLLVAWAIVTQSVSVGAPLWNGARAIAEAFPEDDRVLRVYGSLGTGTWAGPMTG